MVKGNWERRAELVATRRLGEKAIKANKKSTKTKPVGGESVLTKLLRDTLLLESTPPPVILLWLESDPPEAVCRSWLRTEACPQRKCKNKHESSLGRVIGIAYDAEDGQTIEMMCGDPVELRSVAIRDANRLRFVTVNGTCIFDHQYPDLWVEWLLYRSPIKPAEGEELSLQTIKEAGDGGDGAAEGADEAEAGPGSDPAQDEGELSMEKLSLSPASFSRFFLDFDNQSAAPFAKVMVGLLPFLTNEEVVRLVMTNKHMLHHGLKIEWVRARQREGLALFSSQQSKAKKSEKKKKIKNANVKRDSKKDGFARGGNS
ncbi:hypothetical protein B484DRAFT_459504 [Ochromonadaceae sp. CCMP2298]|nr:hypothetical protein B484DRAFT_459504 [Ochromonadaceae sp. CCMP2298]|mmetsp:Transcript_11238/g.25215  ORF Transcript_11238/g.25215 Transcript_11238/m.25215 type:complete len:316 (-) Transcript_11238:59-1006(-)